MAIRLDELEKELKQVKGVRLSDALAKKSIRLSDISETRNTTKNETFESSEAIKQFLVGLGNSAAFSVPELVAPKKFEELRSENVGERVARGVGTTVGSVYGLPGVAFNIGSKLALKGISKTTPKLLRLAKVAEKARKGTKLAKEANKAVVAEAAIRGAGGTALFNAIDPNTKLEDKPERILGGLVGGAVVGAAGSQIPKAFKRFGNKSKKQLAEQAKVEKTVEPPVLYNNLGQKINSQGEVIPQTTIVPSLERTIPAKQNKVLEDLQFQATKILAQKRGIIPHKDLNKLSEPIIKTIQSNRDDFYGSIVPGTTKNAETLNAMANDMVDLFSKNLSGDDLLKAEDYIIKASGVASEVGRALGTLSRTEQMAADKLNVVLNNIKRLSPEGQKAAGKFLAKYKEPTFWDKFFEYRNASLLTSPATQERNIIGNSIGRIFTPIEKFVSGLTNKLESKITGKQQEVFTREAAADVIGMFRGQRQGIRNAINALMDENFISDSRLSEAVRFRKAIPGVAGKIIRTPFRFLGAMDEYFATVSKSANLYSLVLRDAIKKGRTWNEAIDRATALIKDPSKMPVHLLDEIHNLSLKETFRQPLGKSAAHFQNALINNRVGQFIVPFFRTPVNLFKWTFDRAPIGLISPGNWKAIIKGSPQQRAEAISRVAIGQTISAGVFLEALNGNITGRLTGNDQKRNALQRQGIQPYSIKVGDKYISYRSYEPISSWLAMVANAAEISKDRGIPKSEKVSVVIGETLKMLKDQSFLRGVSTLFKALDDPERWGPRFVEESVASTVVPAVSGVGYIARLHDPVYRETDSIPEAIKEKLPYFRKGLPERIDVWGRPITAEGSLMQRAILPSRVTTLKPDLTEEELLSVEKFPRKINKRYKGIDLTTSERNEVTRVEGKIAKELLDKAVLTEEYKSMSPEDQYNLLDKITRKVRREVRAVMIEPIFLDRLRKLDDEQDRINLIEDFTNKKLFKR